MREEFDKNNGENEEAFYTEPIINSRSEEGSDGGDKKNNAAETAKKEIKKITKRIKNSDVLQPETIKDMFFGSGNADDPYYDDDEQQVLFKNKKKKRPVANPDKDKMIFNIEYMLTPDQAQTGYLLFYNEFVKKRALKTTLLFGTLAVVFLISIMIWPDSYLNYLLLVICLAVIAMRWLNGTSAKREAMLSADDVKNDSYNLNFYNSRIVIQAYELSGDKIYNYPPVMIRFEDIELKVLDYDDIYVLIFRKDYVYTVPKEALSEKMNSVFRSHLKNILSDDYIEFYKKEKDSAKIKADDDDNNDEE